MTEVRLPATLFRDREFVVEGKLEKTAGNRAVHFEVLTVPPAPSIRWDGKSQVVASSTGTGHKQLIQGYEDFRSCFPQFICFEQVIPTDEIVSLKMYHREDEPLVRLFLDDEQKTRLDHLWEEHRFISQQPVAENNYLPQFIGFVTQDQPKALVAYFEAAAASVPEARRRVREGVPRPPMPKQLDRSARVRRPGLSPAAPREREDRPARSVSTRFARKGRHTTEAFRGVLARVLVSPAFLFRIEQAPAGKAAGPVNDLGTRHPAQLFPLVVCAGR